MTKWFINVNNLIKGPFTVEEIKLQLRSLNEQLQTTFLWSRGHTDWIRADKWTPDLSTTQPAQTQSSMSRSETESETKPDSARFAPQAKPTLSGPKKSEPQLDLVKSVQSSLVEKFRVQYDLVDQGEMTKEELMTFTAKQEDVAKITVFDKKMNEWRQIYSMADVVQRLGITRRANQRVPILAQFNGVHLGSGAKINARVITISRGGIGVTDNFELKLGETIQGQLTSPHFYSPVNITAEVTYAGLDGYVGLKFVNMNDEMIAHIIDYLKRFGKDSEET